MPIELICTQCASRLRVGDEHANQQVRCPSCQQINTAPGPTAVDAALAGSPTIAPKPAVGDLGDSQTAVGDGNPFAVDSDNPYRATNDPSATYLTSTRGPEVLASRMARLGGSLLDSLIHLPAVLPGIGILVIADNETTEMVGLVVLLAGVLIVQVINWVMITNRGQSIAKWMLGMRIVGVQDGQLPGFVRGVILRIWVPALLSQLCSAFQLIDALWIFGDERRCLHDHIARTIVVETKAGPTGEATRLATYSKPGDQLGHPFRDEPLTG